MMDKPIDLTQISPSCVGDYAVCLLQLVFDTDFPDSEQDDRYAPHRDFGTICHYHAQEDFGAAPDKMYTIAEREKAREHPKVPTRLNLFEERVKKVVTQANSVIRKLSPLEPGEKWIAEHSAYSEELMPNRVGRKGGVGFGGSVDLLHPRRTILWDYKFSSSLPDSIKPTYLWQLCSYHLATGVPKTGILWTEVSGKASAYLIIDWSQPKMAQLAKYIHGGLKLMQLPNFREYAYPIKGAACFFCPHKRRCPLQAVPGIVDSSHLLEAKKINPLDDLIQINAGPPVSDLNTSGGLVAPPPIPPVAALTHEDPRPAVGEPAAETEPELNTPPPLPPVLPTAPPQIGKDLWGIL